MRGRVILGVLAILAGAYFVVQGYDESVRADLAGPTWEQLLDRSEIEQVVFEIRAEREALHDEISISDYRTGIALGALGLLLISFPAVQRTRDPKGRTAPMAPASRVCSDCAEDLPRDAAYCPYCGLRASRP